MKRKISFLISALCALGACASLTACMTDSQKGNDENIEKAKTKTNIVEQQSEDQNECPDGDCPKQTPDAPDEAMPPMPEFRFIPNPEHMPMPDNGGKSAERKSRETSEDGESDETTEDKDGEKTEDGKKPPMPAPHKRGKVKPKMPKTGK